MWHTTTAYQWCRDGHKVYEVRSSMSTEGIVGRQDTGTRMLMPP